MTANTESRFRYPRRPIWVRALNLLVHHAPLRPRYGHNSILMRRALRDDDMGCDTACRGRGAGRDFKRGVIAALAREGGREVLSLVRPELPASLHLHISLGSQPDCLVYGYRLGSWQHTFFSPRPSRSQLQAWARDAVPTGG
jgi:hypothetical protein